MRSSPSGPSHNRGCTWGFRTFPPLVPPSVSFCSVDRLGGTRATVVSLVKGGIHRSDPSPSLWDRGKVNPKDPKGPFVGERREVHPRIHKIEGGTKGSSPPDSQDRRGNEGKGNERIRHEEDGASRKRAFGEPERAPGGSEGPVEQKRNEQKPHTKQKGQRWWKEREGDEAHEPRAKNAARRSGRKRREKRRGGAREDASRDGIEVSGPAATARTRGTCTKRVWTGLVSSRPETARSRRTPSRDQSLPFRRVRLLLRYQGIRGQRIVWMRSNRTLQGQVPAAVRAGPETNHEKTRWRIACEDRQARRSAAGNGQKCGCQACVCTRGSYHGRYACGRGGAKGTGKCRHQTGNPLGIHPVYRVPVRAPIPEPERMPRVPRNLEPGEVPTLNQLGIRGQARAGSSGVGAVGDGLVGGESEAMKRLGLFLHELVAGPSELESRRIRKGNNFSSNISPWLAMGCLSPRQMYANIKSKGEAEAKGNAQARQALDWVVFELLWRDFFRFITKKYGHRKENGSPVFAAANV
eukprot:scaffold1518_cov331-Pavlova_lutheri.AAC.29